MNSAAPVLFPHGACPSRSRKMPHNACVPIYYKKQKPGRTDEG